MGSKRFSIIIFAALALSACGPQQEAATADCARTTTRELSWEGTETRATLIARASGETCLNAAVTLEVASGGATHSLASTYHAMTAGGAPSPHDAPVAPATVDAFLASWTDATRMTSAQLPAWRAGADHPGDADGALPYRAAITRESYEALRARALPTLCLSAGVDAVECVVIDGAEIAPILGYQP